MMRRMIINSIGEGNSGWFGKFIGARRIVQKQSRTKIMAKQPICDKRTNRVDFALVFGRSLMKSLPLGCTQKRVLNERM